LSRWPSWCPRPRYAGVLFTGADRIVRCHLSPALWKEVPHEVSVGMAPRGLPSGSTLQPALAGERWRDLTVRWMHVMPVEIDQPEATAATLDRYLRQQATEMRLTLPLETP
jgi:hypothetical protein